MCEVLSSWMLCPVFIRKESQSGGCVSPSLCHGLSHLPTCWGWGAAGDIQPFYSCSVNNLGATASPVNLTQTWGSEICCLEKDGRDEGRKSLKSPGLLHIGIRIPCGQLMSAGASQRVCHLWCRVDGASRNNWLKSLASVDTF